MRSALSGESLLFLVENLAKRPPLDPLHHHADAPGLVVRQHFYDAGMIQLAADIRLAVEPVVKEDVHFVLRVRDFDRDGLARALVGAAKDGRHAALRYEAVDPVSADPVAGLRGGYHFDVALQTVR